MSNLGCFVADDAQKKLLELGQGQCLSWILTVAESNWSTVFLISQAEFNMQWTLCLLGVIRICKFKGTVSSTCLKYDYEKPNINFNTWNYNFLVSLLSVLSTNIILTAVH